MMKTLHLILIAALLCGALGASADEAKDRQTDKERKAEKERQAREAQTAREKAEANKTLSGKVQTLPNSKTQNPYTGPAGRDWQQPDRDRRNDWQWDRDRDRRDRDYDDNRWDRDRRGGRDRYRPEAHRSKGWSQPYHGRYQNQWRYNPLTALLLRAFTSRDRDLMGAVIVGADDTFLGVISRNQRDEDSIGNPWGRFGSPWSPYSIWNPDGRWGSRYASNSPWNASAKRPPRVYDGKYFRGYLTTNPRLYPQIDPRWLMDYLDLDLR